MGNPRFIVAATLAFSALAFAGCATAQQPEVSDQDHQAHHPDGAAAKPGIADSKSTQGAARSMGQGGMGMGMMGGQGMMDQGSTDMCPMMGGGKNPEDHKAMMQQRLKNMSPEQVKQAMAMMDKHMSMMQGDMQMMRDHLGTQGK